MQAKGTEPVSRSRLGELLVERKLITAQILQEALQEQCQSGRRIGEILLDRGHVTEAQLIPFLTIQLKLPYADVSALVLGSDQLNLIPETLARKYTVLPVRLDGKRLDVVMADPMDHEAIQDLSFVTGCQVSPTLGSRSQIKDAIERCYARHLGAAGRLMAKGVGQATTPLPTPRSQAARALDADAEDAPVVQLMNLIMRKAIQLGASDIHIEPGVPEGTVRFRLDGLRSEEHTSELQSRLHLVCRLLLEKKKKNNEQRVRVRVQLSGSLGTRRATETDPTGTCD